MAGWRPLFLGILLYGALAAEGTGEPMKAHGGLSSARAFDVHIQLRLETRENKPTATHTLNATSTWSGVIQPIPGCEDSCEWVGDMQVRARAEGTHVYRGKHTDSYTFSAQGSDQQPMGLTFYEDDTFAFSLGYAQIPGTQSLACSEGKCQCDPDITAFYSQPLRVRLPIPRGAQALSATQTFKPPEFPHNTFTVTWSFTPAGKAPELKAIPKVPGTATRGESITLDGSASTGRIQDYTWTFSGGKAAPDGSMPDLGVKLHGAQVQVVLLDGMQVTLTVTDAERSHAKTVPVNVLPRKAFETKVSHSATEGRLSAPAPMLGRKGWEGGENVCAFDPPATLDEPVHILHPQSEGYTVAEVSGEGPYAGFSYIAEWKIEVKRQSLINKWIAEDGPPILSGLKSFYNANLDLKTQVVAYLAAARKHERTHTTLMERSIRANDPAKFAERTFGKDAGKVRRTIDDKLKDAERAAANASKDPLPKTWTGQVAVPTPDTGTWTLIETDV